MHPRLQAEDEAGKERKQKELIAKSVAFASVVLMVASVWFVNLIANDMQQPHNHLMMRVREASLRI